MLKRKKYSKRKYIWNMFSLIEMIVLSLFWLGGHTWVVLRDHFWWDLGGIYGVPGIKSGSSLYKVSALLYVNNKSMFFESNFWIFIAGKMGYSHCTETEVREMFTYFLISQLYSPIKTSLKTKWSHLIFLFFYKDIWKVAIYFRFRKKKCLCLNVRAFFFWATLF